MPCSPGLRQCRRDCLHRAMVLEYRDAVFARLALRESECYMTMEDDDFKQAIPPVTFKGWLIGRKGSGQEAIE